METLARDDAAPEGLMDRAEEARDIDVASEDSKDGTGELEDCLEKAE
jgi:hypothetical protein